MGLLDDLKAKADVNGDGKIDKADLDALNEKYGDNEAFKKLKDVADKNDDGKIDLEDAKGLFNFDSIGDKIGDMFGKK